jgi:hypothetical protein
VNVHGRLAGARSARLRRVVLSIRVAGSWRRLGIAVLGERGGFTLSEGLRPPRGTKRLTIRAAIPGAVAPVEASAAL